MPYRLMEEECISNEKRQILLNIVINDVQSWKGTEMNGHFTLIRNTLPKVLKQTLLRN